VEAEMILVAIGRAINTDGIGLEKVGIVPEKGFIPVGDYNQTRVPGVYAVGDVVATPLLAHVAFKEAEIAVERIAGKSPHPRIDPLSIPSATYCEPQVASFGLPEWKAAEKGIAFAKASFPYRGAGKSVAVEQSEGFVKVIYDPKTREILGAHIVGADATELIHELLLARTAELLPEDIATMIHAHPTLSEAVGESMRAVEGWAIHISSRHGGRGCGRRGTRRPAAGRCGPRRRVGEILHVNHCPHDGRGPPRGLPLPT
jgi:dihydrolipoamide dehydrogenase